MGVANSSHDHYYLVYSLDIQFSIPAKRKPITMKQNATMVSVTIGNRCYNHFYHR